MKRIIRLTESDLTRIVRRVIAEQKNPPLVDGGVIDNGTGSYVAVESQPSVSPGSGYKGLPSAQVKFNGLVFDKNGSISREGGITLFAICGSLSQGDGSTAFNPGSLSTKSTADVAEGGATYLFKKGGVIDTAVREYCKSKGKPSDPNTGNAGDKMGFVQSQLSKVTRK
jgi:hypothetical protein